MGRKKYELSDVDIMDTWLNMSKSRGQNYFVYLVDVCFNVVQLLP